MANGKTIPNAHALELIKIALQSNAIKLQGSERASDVTVAANMAKKDAAYLRELYEQLGADAND